jgi:hypothetical protein
MAASAAATSAGTDRGVGAGAFEADEGAEAEDEGEFWAKMGAGPVISAKSRTKRAKRTTKCLNE